MRKLLLILALVGVTVSSVASSAGAACVVPRTEDGLTAAPVVFVGTVTALDNADRTATFDVQWVWKGQNVSAEAEVQGESLDPAAVSADDRRFQLGITYLVASSTAAPPYRSDRCTATRVWQELGSIIPPNYQDAIGAETARAPEPVVVVEDSASVLENPLVPIGVGVLFAVILIFAISRVFRGPEHVARPTTKRRGRRLRSSRLPTIGRGGEGISGGLRRSGVSQADKLRKRRTRGRKRTKKRRGKSARSKLRTDRLDSPQGDADEAKVNA